MIELRKAIQTYLSTIHSETYFESAPEGATFPYIIFTVDIYDSGEGEQLVDLEIDGWDNNPDTTSLENLMNSINQINKTVLATDDGTVVFYLDYKKVIKDDDSRINRRKYIYSGKYYERS